MTKLEYEQKLEQVETRLKEAKSLNVKNNRFLIGMFSVNLIILIMCIFAVHLENKSTLEIIKCNISSVNDGNGPRAVTNKNYNNQYKIDVYRNNWFNSVSEAIYSFNTIEEARNAAEIIGCKW